MKFTERTAAGERRLKLNGSVLLTLLVVASVAAAITLWIVWLTNTATEPDPATVYLRNGVVIQCDDASFYGGNLFRCDGVDYTRHTIDRVVWP